MSHRLSLASCSADDSFNCWSNSSSSNNGSSSSCSFLNFSSGSPNSSKGSSNVFNVAPDVYTFATAKAAASSMPKILENGRKVFGPPASWKGARPSHICELFLTRVPERLEEEWFLIWLHRFGTVYEFRLMMDSGNSNRGYAFILFSKESEALAAYELLSFHFQSGERLGVFRSQGKNRLYVSNIPKELPVNVVKAGFRMIFPQLQGIMAYESKTAGGPIMCGDQNRGYVFVQFSNHDEALDAKKRTTPGRIRMWNTDLKVQWAKPRTQFNTSSVVECTDNWHGQQIPNRSNNASSLSTNRYFNNYNAKLRLFCLANNWCIPIVLYGRSFRENGMQYGGILLKNENANESCYIIMEVAVEDVYDVHLIMCEVAVLLIEREAGFPHVHYLLRVQKQQAEIVQTFSNSNLSCSRNSDFYFYHADSVSEITAAFEMLSQHSSEELLACYKRSFLAATESSPFLNLGGQKLKIKIYTILPKFRNNAPLNCNLNDAEINLMLDCCAAPANYILNQNYYSAHNKILHLKSQRLNLQSKYLFRYIDVQQGCLFYHPAQQMNTPPIWVSGHTYQKSFYN